MMSVDCHMWGHGPGGFLEEEVGLIYTPGLSRLAFVSQLINSGQGHESAAGGRPEVAGW